MTIQTDGINKDSYGNKEIQEGRLVYAADTASTDTYVVTLQPAATEYVTGMVINFLATTANTGAATLNVNGLGAKNILKNHDQTLADGDIEAAQVVTVVYDGTQFQMQSQTGTALETGDLGANVATFLATPTSANLAAAVTNETGSGALVFGTSPTIATPVVTWPAGGPVLTNLITNSQGKAWSGSGLTQGLTVGRTTDFNVSNIYTDADGSTFASWTGSNLTITDGGANLLLTATATAAASATLAPTTFVVGKLYKVSIITANGTHSWDSATDSIGATSNAGVAIAGASIVLNAGTNSFIWEATETNNKIKITIGAITDTQTLNITSIYVDEVTPGYVAADTLAPDTMTKTATLDIHREWNAASANTYGYGTFLFKLTKGADTAEYLNFGTAIDYRDCQGKAVTLGCYVYSVTATDNIKLSIHDGLTEVGLSSGFVGADAVTWVELTATLAAGATALTPRILCDGDTADVAYISEPILVRGSSIGSGNYQPIPNEVIQLQATKYFANYNNSTPAAAAATINLEAESDGQIGKGVKRVSIQLTATNSAANKSLVVASASNGPGAMTQIQSQVNAQRFRGNGDVACDSNGDIYYQAEDTNWSAVYIAPRAIQT